MGAVASRGRYRQVMGNRRHSKTSTGSTKNKDQSVKSLFNEEQEQPHPTQNPAEGKGVREWFATEEGVGWMQFFVIGNSLLLLLTTTLPRIWETLDLFTSKE